eukprot:PhF_6_TR22229/c0_g1_i1/m.31395
MFLARRGFHRMHFDTFAKFMTKMKNFKPADALGGNNSSSSGSGLMPGLPRAAGSSSSSSLLGFDSSMLDEGTSSASDGRGHQIPLHYRRYLTKEMVFDAEQSKCVLCDETVADFHFHQNYGGHRLSMCTFVIMMDSYKERLNPESIATEWLESAFLHADYYIIKELVSCTDIKFCIKKLKESLLFLKSHGVVKSSLDLSRGRNFEFDQVEWVGDLAMPPVLHEVVSSIFDLETTSHVYPMLGPLMGILVGNPHLELTYDYLSLQTIVEAGQTMVIGKTKADVVEALIGELEMFLWANQIDVSCARVSSPPNTHVHSLLAVANHCRYTLVILIVMTFFYPACSRILPFVHKHANTLANGAPHRIAELFQLQQERETGFEKNRPRPLPPLQHSRRIPSPFVRRDMGRALPGLMECYRLNEEPANVVATRASVTLMPVLPRHMMEVDDSDNDNEHATRMQPQLRSEKIKFVAVPEISDVPESNPSELDTVSGPEKVTSSESENVSSPVAETLE